MDRNLTFERNRSALGCMIYWENNKRQTPDGGINESMYVEINETKQWINIYGEDTQEYFEEVNAPYKQMFIMKDTIHGLLESKSEEFSKIVHEIAVINSDR